MSALCFNADGVETALSDAVTYRLPAITGGTLLYDEAENLKKQQENRELISILNTAYRKYGKVSRCDGRDYKIKTFEVFRPIALSGISTLPDTTADRSLKIQLKRKRRDEKTEGLQIDRLHGEFQKIRDDLYVFALDSASTIIGAYNEFDDNLIPDGVDDRLRNAFEVMMSIASPILCSNPNHPVLSQLQKAVKSLSGVRNFDEEDSNFVRVVNLLKSEMNNWKEGYLILTTDEAVEFFERNDIEDIEEPKDAKSMLRRLGARSESHRIGKDVKRGYKLTKEMVEDLYLRYGGG
jgi:hypothetical protein